MIFLWPLALLGLLIVPLAVWLYRRSLRPPAESVVVHSDVPLLMQAARRSGNWKRHIPAGLYGLALVLALIALARPSLPVLLGDPRAGIVLAVDVSRSMQATDVSPNRFEAARAALRTFIQELPEGARVGLVSFSRNAETVVPLTTDRQKLVEAVDFLQLDLGTAIGDAIFESLKALPTLEERSDVADPRSLATIILLTDGRSVAGSDPLEAASVANEQKVRINTIGIGRITDGPVPGLPEAYAMAAQFDEATLKEIARTTGGEYAYVTSISSLRAAYRDLTRQVQWRVRREEATAYLTVAAGLLLMLSMVFSQLRRRVM